jgi:Dolichyl-phosphate-mannose-protein mannosyltransferase
MSNYNKKYIIICLVILLSFQIVLHLKTNPVTPNSRLFFDISENIYRQGAYSFDGENPTRMIQPLYTLFVLVFYQLTGQNPIFVIIVHIILNLIGFILLLKTSALIYDRQTPLLLPILLIGHIAIWYFSAIIINECLFIFLLICTNYYFIKGFKHDKSKDIILAGIFAGLAFMTRPVGLGYICLMFIPYLIFHRINKATARRLALTYLPIILVILPWTIRNHVTMNNFTPLSSEDRFHLLYASLPDSVTDNREYQIFDPINTEPDKVADSTGMMKTAINNILADPLGFIKRGISKIVMVWVNFPGTREMNNLPLKIISSIIQFGILIFAAIGFIYTKKWSGIILLIPAISCSLILFFTYATTRFTVPALPFILILTAKGFEDVWKQYIYPKLFGKKRINTIV